MSKVCVIFGGSRGIGFAVANIMLEQCFKVAIVSKTSTSIDNACKILHSKAKGGASVLGYTCDITQEADINKTIAAITKDIGPIAILVNSAGINKDGLLMKTKLETIQNVLQTNLIGPMLTSKAVLKSMIQQKEGCIINIGSMVGQHGNVGQCSYSASKAGLVGFSKSLAKEVASRGIRCNVIAPGFIDTDMVQDVANRDKLEKHTLLGRFGKPEEVAQAVQYLVEATYVTGQVLTVDGGFSLNL
ncbi:unnamed protein product [Owenia fusiformis]|uniref:3-ketoacyl-[acyl-carrier-protein] reductase beta subunit n=1 Tax=Owenia fusiformis TaxID=6347 RepID=A0A8J1U843_OWEFU|nr:unnamed protein product [Owenia fusiformis]